jgi:hypothetical protein
MEYQLIDREVVYALRADFDDSFRLLSTGTFLNFHMLQELFGKPMGMPLARYFMGQATTPTSCVEPQCAAPIQHDVLFPHLARRAGALWSGVKPTLRTLRDRLVP